MINVLVVDDHEIFRKGLCLVLSRIPDVKLVAEASSGKECITLLNKYDVDLVLMDIRMPEMDGIETTLQLRKIFPNIKVLALSVFGDEDCFFRMIEAGSSGFLLKNIDKEELTIAINQVQKGNNYFSSELLPILTSRYLIKEETSQDIQFSQREKEVLREIAKGKTNQEIADALYISKRTVDGHKANLIHKTGCKNVLHLLIYALKNGLVEIG